MDCGGLTLYWTLEPRLECRGSLRVQHYSNRHMTPTLHPTLPHKARRSHLATVLASPRVRERSEFARLFAPIPGEGGLRESEPVESPPHPDPLSPQAGRASRGAPHVSRAASQSLRRSRIGEGAETTKGEPRLFAAGPNVERRACIGCCQIVSTKPFMQFG